MRRRSIGVCSGVALLFAWVVGIAWADDSTGSARQNLQEEYDKEIRRSADRDAPLVYMDPVVVTATRAPKQLTQVPGPPSGWMKPCGSCRACKRSGGSGLMMCASRSAAAASAPHSGCEACAS